MSRLGTYVAVICYNVPKLSQLLCLGCFVYLFNTISHVKESLSLQKEGGEYRREKGSQI